MNPTHLHCPDLISYFQAKNELKSRGLTFISGTVLESRGANYIRIDFEIGCFGLCKRIEFEMNNNNNYENNKQRRVL